MTFKIACNHEHGSPISDYHPISLQEIEDMIKLFFDEHWQDYKGGKTQMLADIQCRLTQGIPGMECPIPYDRQDMGAKINEIDTLFLSLINGGGHSVESIALKLFNALNQRKLK